MILKRFHDATSGFLTAVRVRKVHMLLLIEEQERAVTLLIRFSDLPVKGEVLLPSQETRQTQVLPNHRVLGRIRTASLSAYSIWLKKRHESFVALISDGDLATMPSQVNAFHQR